MVYTSRPFQNRGVDKLSIGETSVRIEIDIDQSMRLAHLNLNLSYELNRYIVGLRSIRAEMACN